ncbi:MAG: PIN domain-containing protein [Vulcanimicrobiaceae bacterium]
MVASIRSDAGASRRLLRLAFQRVYRPLLSVPLVLEYEAAMGRPEHLTSSRLVKGEIEALLDAVVALGEPVRLAFRWRPHLRDPNDDMVLETAVNGSADAVVTFNRRDFAAARQFGIAVILPAEAIASLRGEK